LAHATLTLSNRQHTATHCNTLQHSYCSSDTHVMSCTHASHEPKFAVAVCCSVLQCVQRVMQVRSKSSANATLCVAVCCSALQCVAVCCSVLQCVAVRCSVLQYVASCCSVLSSANAIRTSRQALKNSPSPPQNDLFARPPLKKKNFKNKRMRGMPYRLAKTHRMLCLYRSFSAKRALELVALLRLLTCNLRHLSVFATLYAFVRHDSFAATLQRES